MSEEHNYCLYFRNSKLSIGYIAERNKKKLRILNEKGSTASLNQSQCELTWKAEKPESIRETVDFLAKKQEEVETGIHRFDMAEAHELCEGEESVTLKDICGLFLDPPWNLWDEVAVLFALKNDTLYFRNKNELFFPRSSDEIERSKKEEARRLELEEKERLETGWAKEFLGGKVPEVSAELKPRFEQFISRTHHFAIYLKKHPENKHLSKVWGLNLSDEYNSRYILKEALNLAGVKVSWGALLTGGFEHSKPYSEEVMEEVETLINSFVPGQAEDLNTLDETHLNAFTIDSESTEDYDDAISLEKTSTGYAIRLHITDVASFIDENSALFELARNRLFTLYTLKKNFNMFPERLSLGLFSLIEGKTRRVLTYLWETDEELKVLKTDFYRSMIRCRKNHSYKEVDRLTEENDAVFKTLETFCQNQQNLRIKKGALITRKSELKLDISDPENIKAELFSQNTPSNLIVSELAIQANYLAAKISVENHLGGIFRAQEAYTLTRDFKPGEHVDMNYVIIKAARISDSPGPHSGLGLDYYMQSTSPIRRFADLVAQHILLKWTQSRKTVFETNRFLMWSKACEAMNKECTAIERELEYHWKLKYLLQNIEREFEGVFVRYMRDGFALISIKEVQILKEINYSGFYEGCRFKLRVTEVDMSLHHFKIEVTEEPEPGKNGGT